MVAQFDAKLSAAEVNAIQDYIAESDNLIALHGEIEQCDNVLEAIEGLLGKYASDLATISTDIRALQEQSQVMNTKLKNRRALQGGLSDFVERVAILPSLIHTIMEAPPASIEFSAALTQLSSKLAFVSNDEGVRRSAAFRDVAPELERLRLAAVTRCRELLLDQIYGLRKPRAHIQSKQAVLLRHRAAASFLRSYGGDIYTEVRAAYAEKVSGKLLDIFRSYWASMERVEETIATAEDLLGAPEGSSATAAGVSSMFSNMLNFSSGTSGGLGGGSNLGGGGGASGFGSSGSRSGMSNILSTTRFSAFALGDRAAVLAAIDAPPLILHEAEAENRRFPFEALFRSLSKLLMDTGSHEYLFCCDFWGEDGKFAYRDAFTPVTSFIQASLAAAVHEMHDPIAILLALRITREHSLLLARRGIPALDDHFDALNLQFWPRLKVILDAHLESLKQVVTTENAGADFVATKVHVVTKRYAALTAAVLALHAEFLDGPLANTIERMRYAVLNLLLTLSRGFSQRGRGTVFLIHNFSHVIAVLKDAAAQALPAPPPTNTGGIHNNSSTAPRGGGVGLHSRSNSNAGNTHSGTNERENQPFAAGLGPAGDEVLSSFEDSLSRATSLYVESRLTAGAPQLLAFVKRGEAAAAHGNIPEGQIVPGFGPAEAAPVAKDFSGRWERIVGVLNREISQDFGNSAVGRAVQQAAFTQLLLQWSRFLELIKRQGDEGGDVARQAVSMPSIMYALKQHRLG
jgi:vacuolar protein sorting-associated protein 52